MTFVHDDNVYSSQIVISGFTVPNEFDCMHILRPEEKLQLQAYSYKRRKESYYYGRISGKIAVSSFLNLNFQDFYIDKGIFTQPVVCCLKHSNCQVSISHTDRASAAIAFDEKHPMGIDIETIDSKNSIMVRDHLTSGESDLCSTDNAPLIFWTAKEALSKVLRTGLTIPLELFEINSFNLKDTVYLITFKNFSQYKVCSFFYRDNIVSIAYPSSSHISFNELNGTEFQDVNLNI